MKRLILLAILAVTLPGCVTVKRVTPQHERSAIIEYQFWPTR